MTDPPHMQGFYLGAEPRNKGTRSLLSSVSDAEAYRRGRQAYADKRPLWVNPHVTTRAAHWRAGYEDAAQGRPSREAAVPTGLEGDPR